MSKLDEIKSSVMNLDYPNITQNEALYLVSRIERLEGALRFYASGKIGPIFDDETKTTFKIYEQYGPHSIGDVGMKAREALSEEEVK